MPTCGFLVDPNLSSGFVGNKSLACGFLVDQNLSSGFVDSKPTIKWQALSVTAGVSFRLLVYKQQASVCTVAGTRIPDFARHVVTQLRLLVSEHGIYLSRGHNNANQSTAEATTNRYHLSRGHIYNGGYISRGQMKSKTKTNTILVNKGALASIEDISSEGAMLANKGATSSGFTLTQPTYHQLTQPTYLEQIQQRK